MLDNCDGPSFNAAISPGTMQRNGSLKSERLSSQRSERGGAP